MSTPYKVSILLLMLSQAFFRKASILVQNSLLVPSYMQHLLLPPPPPLEGGEGTVGTEGSPGGGGGGSPTGGGGGSSGSSQVREPDTVLVSCSFLVIEQLTPAQRFEQPRRIGLERACMIFESEQVELASGCQSPQPPVADQEPHAAEQLLSHEGGGELEQSLVPVVGTGVSCSVSAVRQTTPTHKLEQVRDLSRLLPCIKFVP